MISRIRMFFQAREADYDLDQELEFHIAMLEEENTRRGMAPDEARRTARLLLGGKTQLREAHRDTRGLPLFDSLLQDIRYGFRSLLKIPGFTAAAVLTLSIGIGANTAIFSIVDETLFRPLDFPHSEELADIFTLNKASRTFLSCSYPDYEDLRVQTTTFQALSAFVRMPLNVLWKGRSQRLPVEAVTGNFFSMFGLSPTAGRMFRDSDDSLASAPVAMISEEIGNPSAIGQTILVEGKPFTIIGVVPKRYHGTNLNWGDPPRIWIPLQATAIVRPRFRSMGLFQERSMRWLLITGRLKASVSIKQAQAEIGTIAAGIAQAAPTENRDISELVFRASRAKFWPGYPPPALAVLALRSPLCFLVGRLAQ